MDALNAVLRPRGVAVVGASADPRKRGHQAVRALQTAGYRGAIHPVNPRGGEVLGLPVVPSLDAVPQPCDLALVCTPAASAPEVVADCGRAGIPAAVLLAVGFRESGADGAALEQAVAEAARTHGVRLVGPNTSGLLNLPLGLNLIGARGVRAGSLGLLVQSGNLALNLMLDVTRRSADGVSVCVGVGNELDLGFAEFLGALADDHDTRAILVHAEGFRRGPAVLDAAARATRKKPVVLLKAARTEASESAARSHTGAVAGHYAVLRAALRQAGVVEVQRSDELFSVGLTLASQPPAPAGTGVVILSDGGGQGTLAIDLLDEAGIARAETGAGTRAALRELLGPAAAVTNPVDLAGAADADPERFAQALELLVADPSVGAVLVVGLFGGYGVRFDPALSPAEEAAARRMAEVAAKAGRGLVVHTMYAPEDTAPLAVLREAGVPVVESLEVACRCAAALVERGAVLASPPWRPAATPHEMAVDEPVALSEPEARAVLEGAGLPLVPAAFASDGGAAVAAAAGYEGAVALKVVADGIVHKTDAGGVRLGLRGDEAVRQAFDAMAGAAADRGARFRGVLVSPMAAPPTVELLLGGRRDPQVGPVVTVGAGGTWVEIVADVAHRLPPLDDRAVDAMLGELRIAPILSGARGQAGVDRRGLREAVQAMARLLVDRPEVAEAEINPLFCRPDGVVGVDARVYVTPPPGEG